MVYKIFLDTNIILDILDQKRPLSKASTELWQKIETGETDGFISESVLTSTDYILRKTVSKKTRLEILSLLLDYLLVIPTSTAICKKALKTNFPDLEDAVLYYNAIEYGIDFFVTNDRKALRQLPAKELPIVSPIRLLTGY